MPPSGRQTEWLSDEAALEYNRVVDEAAKIDLLDNLDVAALAIYADQFDRYTKASLAIQKDGAVITGKSGRMMNPAVNVQVKAAEPLRSVLPLQSTSGACRELL